MTVFVTQKVQCSYYVEANYGFIGVTGRTIARGPFTKGQVRVDENLTSIMNQRIITYVMEGMYNKSRLVSSHI